MSETKFDAFFEICWDGLKDLALTYLFAEVAWLNVWPLKPIVTYIVNTFSDKLYSVISKFVSVELIILKNSAAQKVFASEAVSLKKVAILKGINSDEYKAQKESAKSALASVAHFGD